MVLAKNSAERLTFESILVFILSFLFTAFLLGYLPGLLRNPKSLMVRGYTRDVDPLGVVVHNSAHHRFVTILLTSLYAMVIVNFCLCHFTNPGTIPDVSPWRKIDSGVPISERGHERKGSGDARYCRICLKYKPDRSHHCRACKR